MQRGERLYYQPRGFAVAFFHYYRMLGVPAGAPQQEIAQAYRKLARQFHPDLHPPERRQWTEEQMKRLNEAYEVLNDPHSGAGPLRHCPVGASCCVVSRQARRPWTGAVCGQDEIGAGDVGHWVPGDGSFFLLA